VDRSLLQLQTETHVDAPSDSKSIVGFEVLMAVSTKMAVFWVVAPCSLVEVYQQGPLKRSSTSTRLHGAATQKTAILASALFA
jgi:hypothetical protein